MKKIFRVFILFFAMQAVHSAQALDVPDKPAGYVNDTAGILSPQAKSRLETTLRSFDERTSSQLVVAVFKSLEGGSLEDFSIRLAERWKPGTEKRDNGVILLIFKEDREVRIEVGYGLEGALPDALCSQIIQNVIVPAFRAGDYDRGVSGAVEAIIAATQGEYKAAPRTDPVDEWIRQHAAVLLIMLISFITMPLICYGLVIFLFLATMGAPMGLAYGLLAALALFIFRTLLARSSSGTTIGGPGGGFSSWGGGRSSGRGFGGGGFSGGGGSFGGGGASGRW